MREFYLASDTQLPAFESILAKIATNELVVLEFDPSIANEFKPKLLQKFSHASKRAFLKINLPEARTLLNSLPTELGFVLKQPVKARSDFFVDPHLIRDHPPEHRCQIANDWPKYLQEFGTRKLIPELVLEESSIPLIFSALSGLAKHGASFVLLDPSQLDLNQHATPLREQLRLLQMTGTTNLEIQFSHPWAEYWNARTENLFAGPRRIDIDVANTCTHNCVFCGLWADNMVALHRKNNGGQILPELKAEFSARIDREHCLRLIHSLPENINIIQFGGKGDPFTHPNIMEFIRASRERNFPVSILSNFAYMNREVLEELHQLAAPSFSHYRSLEFIVNLSAATAPTYSAIRPNQSDKTFHKVIESLEYLGQRRTQDGFGVELIMMSVTNKLNFHEIPEIIALTKLVGARSAWIKPVEIHGEGTLELLLDEGDMQEYSDNCAIALALADFAGIYLLDRFVMEDIAKKSRFKTKESALRALEARSALSELIRKCFDFRNASANKSTPSPHLEKPRQLDFEQIRTQKIVPVTSSTEANYAVQNADSAGKFLDNLPCKIGHQYLRLEVRGRVLPCCIANYPVAKLEGQNISQIWFSHSLASFRQKMDETPSTKFHRKDPEWTFCQQCCHLNLNKDYNKLLGKELEL